MHRLIMDMPLMISASIRHAANHHGKTEAVAIANEGDIHRCDHATAHARTRARSNWPMPCRVWARSLVSCRRNTLRDSLDLLKDGVGGSDPLERRGVGVIALHE